MKANTISSKIKITGTLYIILMTVIIITTIYLNNKNKKDALVINIAGKQRMLTQKISKNIFYLNHNNKQTFTELDNATIEFIYNLNSLKDGNKLIGIFKPPTDKIKNQISKIQILWNSFYNNINIFKEIISNKNEKNKNQLKNIVESVYQTNIHLLNEVDKLVSMYTIYTEKKTEYLKYIQYFFAIFIIFLLAYSFYQLKAMEENAKKFFQMSKRITQSFDNEPIAPIQIDAEKEIVEATDTINCFINKINSAVEYSTNASNKLDEITDEIDTVLLKLNKSSNISKQLDKSEDIVIQSQENMINSTKKLKELKEELDKVAKII